MNQEMWSTMLESFLWKRSKSYLKDPKVDGLLQKRKTVQEMSFGPKSSSSIAVKANFCLHSSMHLRVEKGYHHYCVYNITTTQWDIGNLSRHFKHLSFCSPMRLWVVQRYKAESLAGARKLEIAKPMSKWPLYTAICFISYRDRHQKL